MIGRLKQRRLAVTEKVIFVTTAATAIVLYIVS